MKHNLKITIILLAMFLATQFIGLYVVNHYSTTKVIEGKVVENITAPELPLGLETPQIQEQQDFNEVLISMVIAFVIAIALLFILIRFKSRIIIKFWFFAVVTIALIISLNAFFPEFKNSIIAIAIIAIPLSFFKIYKHNPIIHNLTELLIYPGIASIFVPIFNIYTIIILLIIISIYDMWAVWHSGIMQKMAQYQMDSLKIFAGFFVPYASKHTKKRIQTTKKQLKEGKITKEDVKKKRFKINLAVLGGGDIIFPLITAGVVLKTSGLIPALLVIAGATLGLAYLFFVAEKRKFYPAMPFITSGIFIGLIAGWIFF